MNYKETIEETYAQSVVGMKDEEFSYDGDQWYVYVYALPARLQITYLIVVLHNQVFNGGFHQYFVNGYGQFSKITINL